MRRHWRGLYLVLATAIALGVAVPTSNAEEYSEAVATGSISGRVTAPAGVDVTRVQVNVWTENNYSTMAGSAQPATDGTYTVHGLPAGRYRVEFVGGSVGLLREFWNDATLYDQATLVNVGSGAVLGINATLVRGATLSGTIRTNSDCDLSYVNVWAWGAPGHVIPNSVVKPDGTWTISGIPGSSYWVEFDGRYAGLPRAFWNTTSNPYERSTATVALGQTKTGIDIRLDGPTFGCVPVRPYVFQVYADLLKRNPDQSGFDNWTRALAEGTSYVSVANAITASDEYRSRLIRAAYQRYLGRTADPGGLANWLREMRRGAQIEDIQAAFVASDEFWRKNGGTPQGWVTGLYQTVLGRTPSSWEVQQWVSRMAAGASRRDVARGFLYSTENLTAVVDGYYIELLGRHIDASGKATWVRKIQQGHRDEQIVGGILSSTEYRIKVREAYSWGSTATEAG